MLFLSASRWLPSTPSAQQARLQSTATRANARVSPTASGNLVQRQMIDTYARRAVEARCPRCCLECAARRSVHLRPVQTRGLGVMAGAAVVNGRKRNDGQNRQRRVE
jgi:hypothetical protein